MKKLCLLLACILGLSMTVQTAQAHDGMPPKRPPCGEHMKGSPLPPPDFSKLKLTDVQKAKLDANQKASREKIKPIFNKLKENKTRIDVIKASTTMTEDQKVQKIMAIKKENKELKKQANEIREADMKYFESILTAKQKKTFEKMKQDQIKKMEQARKNHKRPESPKGGNPFEMGKCSTK